MIQGIKAMPPAPLQEGVNRFLKASPRFQDNVFVMMSYRDSELLQEIERVLRGVLSSYGLEAHLAKDRAHSPERWTNIEIYMWSCALGIAVLETMGQRSVNDNVLIETGYMLALNHSVLLLKERRVKQLPGDIHNLVYKRFDIEKVEATVASKVREWVEADLDIFKEVSFRRRLRRSGRDYVVWVSGSCDDPRLAAGIAPTCRFVGRELARRGYVVASGFSPGVGEEVTKGAVEYLKGLSRVRTIEDYVVYATYGSRELPDGYGSRLKLDMDRRRFSRFAAHEADAFVFFHGRNGTTEEFDCADESERLLIPVGASGSSSRRLYERIGQQYPKACHGEITREEWDKLGSEELLSRPEELGSVILNIVDRDRDRKGRQRRGLGS